MSTESINPLVEQMVRMMAMASNNPAVSNDELSQLLRFISKVEQVVSQSFKNIYSLLLKLKYLDVADLNGPKIDDLRQELDYLVSPQYFHDVQLICGQLRVLSDQYRDQISPVIEMKMTENRDQFREMFHMLDQYEGYLIGIFRNMTGRMATQLAEMTTVDDLLELKRTATAQTVVISESLQKLQDISNSILGLSGRPGFLELTETNRNEVQQRIQATFNFTDNSIHTGNISGISGSNFSIGSGNTQTHTTTTTTGLDAGGVAALLRELLAEVGTLAIQPQLQQTAQANLTAAQTELAEEKPDKDFLGKNLQKVADNLKRAGVIVNETTSIGKKLLTIAKWAGTVLAFI